MLMTGTLKMPCGEKKGAIMWYEYGVEEPREWLSALSRAGLRATLEYKEGNLSEGGGRQIVCCHSCGEWCILAHGLEKFWPNRSSYVSDEFDNQYSLALNAARAETTPERVVLGMKLRLSREGVVARLRRGEMHRGVLSAKEVARQEFFCAAIAQLNGSWANIRHLVEKAGGLIYIEPRGGQLPNGYSRVQIWHAENATGQRQTWSVSGLPRAAMQVVKDDFVASLEYRARDSVVEDNFANIIREVVLRWEGVR
ncbi:MAG: hypothetical protein ACOX0G_01790 [Patescibacteria group bacterium]|jgi:hypothetical protein